MYVTFIFQAYYISMIKWVLIILREESGVIYIEPILFWNQTGFHLLHLVVGMLWSQALLVLCSC